MNYREIETLLEIMSRLRDPRGGCPWDVEQDFATIAPYTIEEAYEVADAIDRGDLAALRDELGDLLFQVVFHAQMASEAGHFDFYQVVEAVCDKMVRRHPHVFGDAEVSDAEAQTRAWEEHKAAERRDDGDRSALAGVSRGLPEWMRATKLQKRAARVGFDWPNAGPVLEKIDEELDELRDAMATGDQRRIDAEFGDLLFATVNLGRHLRSDISTALRAANRKFEARFRAVEELAASQGLEFESLSLEQMDELWEEVKGEGGKAGI